MSALETLVKVQHYKGTYDGVNEFDMRILRRGPTLIPCTILPGQIDDVDTELETIEGVIEDSIGVAVFSGLLIAKKGTLSFTKKYSDAAIIRTEGRAKTLVYEGNSDDDGVFRGTYRSKERTPLKGVFELTPVKD